MSRRNTVFSVAVGLASLGVIGASAFEIIRWIHSDREERVAEVTVGSPPVDGQERRADVPEVMVKGAMSGPGTPPLAAAPLDAKTAKSHQEAWAQHLGVPVEIENSIGMRCTLIPPGEFDMGSSAAEQTWAQDEAQAVGDIWAVDGIPCEAPRHRVRITKPFWLGTYEVTQREYQRVMDKNPSEFSASGKGKDKVAGQDTSRFPVEMISWDNATKFCQRLSSLPAEWRAGRGYRLPTEAEWEYACRAGTTTRWSCGDEERDVAEHAWVNGDQPHPIGMKKPNAWGLHDMQGNVWEWCQDGYDAAYYGQSPADDPPGSPKYLQRVYRGGSWYSRAWYARSAQRSRNGAASCTITRGFRAALVPASPPAGQQRVPTQPVRSQKSSGSVP